MLLMKDNSAMEQLSAINWTYEPELDPMLALPSAPYPGKLGGPFGFYVDFEANYLVNDNINLNLKLGLTVASSLAVSPVTMNDLDMSVLPENDSILDYAEPRVLQVEFTPKETNTYFEEYSSQPESHSSDSIFTMSNEELSDSESVFREEHFPREPITSTKQPAVAKRNICFKPSFQDLLFKSFTNDQIKEFGTCRLHCTHCPEEFHEHIKFAAHLDAIKQNRTFKCPLKSCPWSILGHIRKVDLRRHCMVHFPKGKVGREIQTILAEERQNITELVFPCHMNCGKYFYRKDSLKRHIKLLHDSCKPKYHRKTK